MTVTKMAALKSTLETFVTSEDFAEAIIGSTLAGFGGSRFSVELFKDGTWRVLWDSAIGNRYEPTGRIMGVPQLSNEDYRDLCDVAGSSDKEKLVAELRHSDTEMAIADEMLTDFEEWYETGY